MTHGGNVGLPGTLVVLPTGAVLGGDATVEVMGHGPTPPPGRGQSTNVMVVVVGHGPTPPPGRGQSRA